MSTSTVSFDIVLLLAILVCVAARRESPFARDCHLGFIERGKLSDSNSVRGVPSRVLAPKTFVQVGCPAVLDLKIVYKTESVVDSGEYRESMSLTSLMLQERSFICD